MQVKKTKTKKKPSIWWARHASFRRGLLNICYVHGPRLQVGQEDGQRGTPSQGGLALSSKTAPMAAALASRRRGASRHGTQNTGIERSRKSFPAGEPESAGESFPAKERWHLIAERPARLWWRREIEVTEEIKMDRVQAPSAEVRRQKSGGSTE